MHLKITRRFLGICIPETVTTGQMVAVAIKFMDKNPEQRNRNVHRIFADAAASAWPCVPSAKP